MENASKALLMAGSVLIGMLIVALMTVLFLSGREVFNGYEQAKTSEAIQQFNTNFTKYIGQDITAQQAYTIYNFATINGITAISEIDSTDKIKEAINDANSNLDSEHIKVEVMYDLTVSYDAEGRINKITVKEKTSNKYKCYKLNSSTGEVTIEYKS